jgi:hypothetical protein
VTALGAAVDLAMAHGSSPVPTTSCATAFVCQIIRMRQRL